MSHPYMARGSLPGMAKLVDMNQEEIKLISVSINGGEAGSIGVPSIEEYMNKTWPGVSYEVSKDGKAVNITATPEQFIDIREQRIARTNAANEYNGSGW